MKALLIEPEFKKVSLVLYDSLLYVDFRDTIAHLLGAPLDWITEFPNKDGLFAQADSVYNEANRAFSINGCDMIFFGKSLIASVSTIPVMRLRSCRFTLEDICNNTRFHDQRLTELFRRQLM